MPERESMFTAVPFRQNAAFLTCAVLFALPLTASTEDHPWYVFENRYFTALSNAKESDALELLLDLERFRVAVHQVTNVDIPADAPKILVVIFRKKSEFKKYSWSKEITGYLVPGNDLRTPIIVMPVNQHGMEATLAIRHEYAHALTRYIDYRYPSWYQEGEAELMASIELHDDWFVFGKPPAIRFEESPLFLDYDLLIEDDYDIHSDGFVKLGGDPYAQYWLLMHYFLLGGNAERVAQLRDYLKQWNSGIPSSEAFKDAFGKTPSQLWSDELEAYSQKFPNYQIAYDSRLMDTEFLALPTNDKKTEETLAFLASIAEARRNR